MIKPKIPLIDKIWKVSPMRITHIWLEFLKLMNLIFITIDGARCDRIINGLNYKKLISENAFFPNVIAYAPYTIGAMHSIFSGV